MKNEIWKAIKGYEGIYEVSSFGRVRMVEHEEIGSFYRMQRRVRKSLIKKQQNTNNYLSVTLAKEGKVKRHFVHRLVAQAFIPNPNNYPIINHKDENPSNNNVENLEWCTYKYNANYGTAKIKVAKALSIPIYQYDLNMNLIASFPSSSEASRQTGIQRTNIDKVARIRDGRGKGRTHPKQAGGYIWSFRLEL